MVSARKWVIVIILLLINLYFIFPDKEEIPEAPLTKRRFPLDSELLSDLNTLEDFFIKMIIQDATGFFPRHGGFLSELAFNPLHTESEEFGDYNFAARLIAPGISFYGLIANPEAIGGVYFMAYGFEPSLYGMKNPYINALHLDLGIMSFTDNVTDNLPEIPAFLAFIVPESFKYYYPFIHFSYDFAVLWDLAYELFRLEQLEFFLKNLFLSQYIENVYQDIRQLFDVGYNMLFFNHFRLSGQIFNTNRLALEWDMVKLFIEFNKSWEAQAGLFFSPFREGYLGVCQDFVYTEPYLNRFSVESDRLIPLPFFGDLKLFLSGDYSHYPCLEPTEFGFDIRVEWYQNVEVGYFIGAVYYAQNMTDRFMNGIGIRLMYSLFDQWWERVAED